MIRNRSFSVIFFFFLLVFLVILSLGVLWPSIAGAATGIPGSGSLKGTWFSHLPNPAKAGARVPLVPICKLQGSGFTSPYDGKQVRTRGVVYADFDQSSHKGFFIQDPDCDRRNTTSDGIFVFTGVREELVSPGDEVEVQGKLQEFFGDTELVAKPEMIEIRAQNQPLPDAVPLDPPFEAGPASHYFEAREGMHVQLEDARVVGPTNRFEQTWVVRTDLGINRVFHDDPRGTGEIIAISGAGRHKIEPVAKVGDRVLGLSGPLAFSEGRHWLWLLEEPLLVPVARENSRLETGLQVRPEAILPEYGFTIASFNVQNLFDTVDDPGKKDPLPAAAAYRRQLIKLAATIHHELDEPDLIGVQEVENGQVLDDLLSRPEIRADYGSIWVDGPDIRGIDVALLYRQDRVRILKFEQRQGCTPLVDGLGPDGNRDVRNPINRVSCDADGDGRLDGNRLFSRPPLVVQVQVCGPGCSGPPGSPSLPAIDLTLIVNHWKSKSQDTDWQAYTLPRRREQARFVRSLAEALAKEGPGVNLVILGDLNDTLNSEPLGLLAEAGFHNLLWDLKKTARYSYIFQGKSQVLDHILINSSLRDDFAEVAIIHINADYPSAFENVQEITIRSSDHDPILAGIRVLPHKYFLPWGTNGQEISK